MTTKPQILLRVLLLIPYFTWGIALLFTSLVFGSARNISTMNTIFEIIAGVASIYTIGIIFWGIPYTIMAAGLLLWSINKSAQIIYKVFVFSPILLSILTAVEIALISFLPPQAPSPEVFMNFLSSLLVFIVPTLIFGFGFVGAGSILYKSLRRLQGAA